MSVAARRKRLNAIVLSVAGQWMVLMAVFWMRFLPPLRPFAFETPAPPLTFFAAAVIAGCVPYLLPAGWFRPRRFERRMYDLAGLRLFRYLAPDGGFVNARLRRMDPTYRVVGNREELRGHLQQSHSSERAHLAWFLVGLCTEVFAWRTGQILWALTLTAFNVLFNLYPVLHQRHKRSRAERASRVAVEWCRP